LVVGLLARRKKRKAAAPDLAPHPIHEQMAQAILVELGQRPEKMRQN